MAEKKVEQAIKAPTEKQVSLLEKLMAHELEDVQQKALAIVLSIWKKKNCSGDFIHYSEPDGETNSVYFKTLQS